MTPSPHSLDTLLANWKSVLDSNCVSTEQAKRIAKEAYTLGVEAAKEKIKYYKFEDKGKEMNERYIQGREDALSSLTSLKPKD